MASSASKVFFVCRTILCSLLFTIRITKIRPVQPVLVGLRPALRFGAFDDDEGPVVVGAAVFGVLVHHHLGLSQQLVSG